MNDTSQLSRPLPVDNPLTRAAGIDYPIICGAMFPCSNPELVAAVSEAGGLGILQPVSLTYVHGYEFRLGLRKIKELTAKPVGMNVLTEQSSKTYLERMSRWLEVALEEGIRFFVTSLGNPRWVVDRVAPAGGVVYHDVTQLRFAEKARDGGVDGLIAVNSFAGGHAGDRDAEALFAELADLDLPIVCAGGVGSAEEVARVSSIGYCGVQVGTRFIATHECSAPNEYKQAIVAAEASDIVLTHRITGVPVSVINTTRVAREGTQVGWFTRRLLGHPRGKHWARALLTLRSALQLKRSATRGMSHKDYYQAGKSVAGVDSVESAADIVRRFASAISDPGHLT
ncbi:MAG: nitronate monooxygenase [bacterium]|nr:nitronate monooxygenase [bacterium]